MNSWHTSTRYLNSSADGCEPSFANVTNARIGADFERSPALAESLVRRAGVVQSRTRLLRIQLVSPRPHWRESRIPEIGLFGSEGGVAGNGHPEPYCALFRDNLNKTGYRRGKRPFREKNEHPVDASRVPTNPTAPFFGYSMKTFLPKVDVQRRAWRIIDAKGAVLGRLAVQVADALRGKDKPVFAPHLDAGDFVVVVNAEQVILTGKKESDKVYMSYSGWKGGEKRRTVSQIRETHPERLIMHAVKGMLPKNRLGDRLLTKLKVYVGQEHPHVSQQPKVLAYAG